MGDISPRLSPASYLVIDVKLLLRTAEISWLARICNKWKNHGTNPRNKPSELTIHSAKSGVKEIRSIFPCINAYACIPQVRTEVGARHNSRLQIDNANNKLTKEATFSFLHINC